MALIHGSAPLFYLVLGLWLLAIKCAALDTTSLDQLLGETVLLALQNARITVKEAAGAMAMHESHLHKCLRGDRSHHLSLNRLVKLPFAFWLFFSPSLIYLVAKQNTVAIAEELGLRKVR